MRALILFGVFLSLLSSLRTSLFCRDITLRTLIKRLLAHFMSVAVKCYGYMCVREILSKHSCFVSTK